jgi:hypothetical protein
MIWQKCRQVSATTPLEKGKHLSKDVGFMTEINPNFRGKRLIRVILLFVAACCGAEAGTESGG